MSTLYIRHPSKASIEHAPPGVSLAFPYAWVSDSGAILRQDQALLPSLAGLLAQARQVVVLLAACDVTLLRVAVPPLSAAKLKAALPHLVEDQLIADPADSVLVAGALVDGMRSIAVAQRAWLAALVDTLAGLGARAIALLPEQLCLPYQAGVVSAAVALHGNGFELALRLSEHGGLGLAVLPELSEEGVGESAVREVMQALRVLAQDAPVILSAPPADVALYQRAADAGVTVIADDWSRWIGGAQAGVLTGVLNLLPGLGLRAGAQPNWKRWRWPLVLVALLLLVNIVGLNVEWLRLKREAEGLRAIMLQTYKSTYPKETVIIDPLLQMRQKIALGRNAAGQPAPDDFTALVGAFGEAWALVATEQEGRGVLAGIDYQERSLLVRVKPGSETLLEKIRPALAARNLALAQPTAGVWQVKSVR